MAKSKSTSVPTEKPEYTDEKRLRVCTVCDTEFHRTDHQVRHRSSKCTPCSRQLRRAGRAKDGKGQAERDRYRNSRTPEQRERMYLRSARRAMINRCTRSNHPSYAHYGARGITVCQRWRDSFEAFAQDVGSRPSLKHSLDRVDNNRGYEPGNVRWALHKEQMNNTRQTRHLTFRGETRPLTEWAVIMSINARTLHGRIQRFGADVARALTTPVRSHGRNKTRTRAT